MRVLGELESGFSEVEVALLALEDTIDAREAQERQLEQRFQLAIYQERRRQELEELAAKLDSDCNLLLFGQTTWTMRRISRRTRRPTAIWQPEGETKILFPDFIL